MPAPATVPATASVTVTRMLTFMGLPFPPDFALRYPAPSPGVAGPGSSGALEMAAGAFADRGRPEPLDGGERLLRELGHR